MSLRQKRKKLIKRLRKQWFIPSEFLRRHKLKVPKNYRRADYEDGWWRKDVFTVDRSKLPSAFEARYFYGDMNYILPSPGKIILGLCTD